MQHCEVLQPAEEEESYIEISENKKKQIVKYTDNCVVFKAESEATGEVKAEAGHHGAEQDQSWPLHKLSVCREGFGSSVRPGPPTLPPLWS